jgi:hypothetical protein
MSDLSAIALLLSSTVIGEAWHFGPWAVGCDNTDICAAMTVLHPQGELGGERQPVIVRVTSHPAPNHKPRIELLDLASRHDGRSEWTERQSEAGLVVTLRKQRNSELPNMVHFTFERQDNGNYLLPEEHTTKMLQALINLPVIELEMPNKVTAKADLGWNDEAGQPERRNPFTAVLNWFDDTRDVEGTAYATLPYVTGKIDTRPPPVPSEPENIVRVGFSILFPREKPARPLPIIESCLPNEGAPLVGYKLNSTTKLWKQECDESSGKGRSIWFTETVRGIKLVIWPQSDRTSLGNVHVNHWAGTVQAFESGSRNDDCGVIRSWGWTGDAGEFRLLEQREMPLCMGVPSKLWLRTWRTDHTSFKN